MTEQVTLVLTARRIENHDPGRRTGKVVVQELSSAALTAIGRRQERSARTARTRVACRDQERDQGDLEVRHRVRPANVSALTCGRNGNSGDDAADTPTRAAGAKRTRREGHQDANAPVRFSGWLGGELDW